ncbi:MAG: ribosome recycling factor [Bacilli bacterium]
MDILNECVEKMDKCKESLKESLGTLRAGRVTAQLLDKVYVKAYGENMSLKSLGTIGSSSPTDLQVKVFDPSTMKDIIAGLNKADLGCTVTQNGALVMLKFPAPSEDRRKDLVKQAKKYGEDAKVAIRNVRKDFNNKAKKEDTLSEDMQHDLLDEIQKSTDNHITEVDKMIANKITDIETI